jgi:hypothetical protein
MVACVYNLSTWEAEAGRWRVLGQSRITEQDRDITSPYLKRRKKKGRKERKASLFPN